MLLFHTVDSKITCDIALKTGKVYYWFTQGQSFLILKQKCDIFEEKIHIRKVKSTLIRDSEKIVSIRSDNNRHI